MARDTSVMPRQTPRPASARDALVIRRLTYERTREDRDWSTAEVARRLTAQGFKISQSSVWAIENDPRRKITLAEAQAFAELYGLEIADLFKLPQDVSREKITELQEDVKAFRRDARRLLKQLVDLIKRADDLSNNPDVSRALLDYTGFGSGGSVGTPTGDLRKEWSEALRLVEAIAEIMPEHSIAVTFEGRPDAEDSDGEH